MEDVSYINIEISLFKRMKFVFLPYFLGMIFLFVCIGIFSAKTDIYIALTFFFIYTILFAIITYFRTNSYIYAIHIIENKVIINEQYLNTKLEDEIQISDLKFELKGEMQGRFNCEYVLILKSITKEYKINSLYNWDYFKLLELFKDLKKLKEEKITLDDKFIMERVEKKALGFSLIEVTFGN